jgi:triosephosphate isomerase (TIM)
MNGLKSSALELEAIIAGAPGVAADLLVCPPATLVAAFANLALGTSVSIGAQDCHAAVKGAHTGDLSAEMFADAGASAIIVGHSERRMNHGETDAIVCAKAEAVVRAGLKAIVCVGESRLQRDAGEASTIVEGQLAGSIPPAMPSGCLVVAYEPVWAIGTGLVPTLDEIAQMHAVIRSFLDGRYGGAEHVRILYGGSVKPDNCAPILSVPNVDGALVGGASLKASDFLAIAGANC